MADLRIDRLLDTLIAQKASELKLAVGAAPALTRAGRSVEMRTAAMDSAAVAACLAGMRRFEPSMVIGADPLDFAFVYSDVLMRCTVCTASKDSLRLIVHAMLK